ncbi:hypothetical protein [Mycolicibacterium sp. 120270]|uniref:hypothetical protein n=1 Tax=Mycolicibacterium sp. 120270 TaxID=3090600 RepID=UPI00299EA337|nr:hypothetical protein [Mycolicibacterium sp. 120270]MDX1885192.1 hypothetical protein [Mycolicibacterium sp. 120270]
MKVQKVGAGAVFVGAVLAAVFGAGNAAADAGISFSANGGEANGFGDRGPGGAQANSGKEGNFNTALAISTGLSPAGAVAQAGGHHNNLVSIDGVSITGPGTGHNNVVTAFGGTLLVANEHDNNVVNAGSLVVTNPLKLQNDKPGVTNISVCGSTVSGQADHITVSSVPGGLC